MRWIIPAAMVAMFIAAVVSYYDQARAQEQSFSQVVQSSTIFHMGDPKATLRIAAAYQGYPNKHRLVTITGNALQTRDYPSVEACLDAASSTKQDDTLLIGCF